MELIELAEKYITSTSVSLFLTGKAGTGKTTFLQRIVSTVNKRCVVVAPTGVAAVNAGGVTIHSFFQLPLCPYLPDVKELVTEYQMASSFKSLRKEKVKIIRTLDLLIIDEISMVRADLLDAVDMTLRRYRRSAKPFGGVQLLMIGDVQQLPPVVKDKEKEYLERVYPSPFFFHSKALSRTQYKTIELTHVFRQKDARFVALLNNLRDNKLDKDTLDALNSRYQPRFDPPDNEGYIRLTTHNWQANEVNRRKLEALLSTPFDLVASVEGNFPPTSYPTEERLTLKKGTQVMFVRNDSNGHQYYNGKIATVEGYDPEEGVAVVDRDGNHIVVKKERWENVKYEIGDSDNQIHQKVEGVFVQYPLRLAWAVTVHKSQGLTFDKVVVDVASAFSYGQVYVALSRCRSLDGLVLASPISDRCVFDNEDVFRFNQSMPSVSVVEQELGTFQKAYIFELINELFDFSPIVRAVDRLNALFHQHLSRMFPDQTQKMSDLYNGLVIDLSTVSEKFHKQLMRLSLEGGSNPYSPVIKERVDKGTAYFDDKLEQILLTAAPLLEVKIGNKAVAADFETWATEFRDAIGLKQRCIGRVREKGFSSEVYNGAKVDYLLEKDGPASRKKSSGSKRNEKRKEPKPKKPPVWHETVNYFLAGKTFAEIAVLRGLKTSTIGSHLEQALEAGAITVDKIMTSEELDEIVEYIIEERPESLTVMFKHFDGRYPYHKLRAAAFEAKDL